MKLLQHRVGHMLLSAVDRRDDRHLDIGLGVDRRDLARMTRPIQFAQKLTVARPLIHIRQCVSPWTLPSLTHYGSSTPPSTTPLQPSVELEMKF